jgi:hypothetical protein
MKLSAQRKISLGLLLLAVVAFGIDRCFFTPGAASAKDRTIAPTPTTPKKIARLAANDRGEELRDLSAVSHRLESADRLAHADENPSPDAFQPPAAWVNRSIAKSMQGAPSAAERFRARHRLAAVMTGQQSGWAIVDGNTITLGQSIAGFRLTEVRDHSALFQSADAQVELQMPR